MVKQYGFHAFVEFELDDKVTDPEYRLPSIKTDLDRALREILSEQFQKRTINKPTVLVEFEDSDAQNV